MEEQLVLAKQAFLNRYNVLNASAEENRQMAIEKALSRAITASVQHNPTYHPNCNTDALRRLVRVFWGQQLIVIAEKYKEEQSIETYENEILELQRVMNENVGHCFQEHGFKISHSQKSISVYLKHLWCIGLIATPPLCPVDRMILTHIGHGNAQPPWTQVTTIEQYRAHVALLTNHYNLDPIRYEKIAEWELMAFAIL